MSNEKPRFCVMGAGHGGTAMAAHLALKGFQVNLYNRSDERLIPIKERGNIELLSPGLDDVEKGEGVLQCNERDRQTVQGALHGTGADRVTLSPENGSMQGGVLLTGVAFDLDLTLDSALTDLRGELAVDLAAKLFANVPAMCGTRSADEE